VPASHELAEALFATARTLRRRAGRLLLDDELTYERLRLLTYLRDDGDLTMTELSRRLGVTPRAVTGYAEVLESSGLVSRQQHPQDGRATLLHLTTAGRARTDRLWQAHRQSISAIVDHLSDDQKIALQDVLHALAAADTPDRLAEERLPCPPSR